MELFLNTVISLVFVGFSSVIVENLSMILKAKFCFHPL